MFLSFCLFILLIIFHNLIILNCSAMFLHKYMITNKNRVIKKKKSPLLAHNEVRVDIFSGSLTVCLIVSASRRDGQKGCSGGIYQLAERAGFEPARQLLAAYSISSRAPSTGLGHLSFWLSNRFCFLQLFTFCSEKIPLTDCHILLLKRRQ